MYINEKVYELREELIKETQNIIKIKSVEEAELEGKPFGNGVSEALDYVLELSQKLGFKTKNLDGYIGYAEYGEGDDYVGVLGHLDVVPEGDGWIYAPYGAEIHDNKIYGRGATDDKGPIMAALYGLKALKDLNIPLSKKVRIIFGTNEETGCKETDYYLEREKPPISGFTPDAEYPIVYAEKGLTTFDVIRNLKVKSKGRITIKTIKGGQRPNMVPDYCEAILEVCDKENIIKSAAEYSIKVGLDIRVEELETNNDSISLVVVKAFGVSAHGATPHIGRNAVMMMFKFLDTLPIENCDATEFINFFNLYVGLETDGKAFGVGLCDKPSGQLSFNVGTIYMDDDKISMGLNLRYPVTYKFEDLIIPLNKKLEGTHIRIENMRNVDPLYFEADHPLISTLQRVYTKETGNEATLIAMGGGTYAKTIPNIVAFGPIFPGKPDLDHQANEYIEIEDLIANAKIYAHAIYELAK